MSWIKAFAQIDSIYKASEIDNTHIHPLILEEISRLDAIIVAAIGKSYYSFSRKEKDDIVLDEIFLSGR